MELETQQYINKGIDEALVRGATIEEMSSKEMDALMAEAQEDFEDFSKDVKIMHADCAQSFLEDHEWATQEGLLICYYREEFYIFDTKKYVSRYDNKTMMIELQKWFRSKAAYRNKVKEKDRREVLAHIQAITMPTKIKSPPFFFDEDFPFKPDNILTFENTHLILSQYIQGKEICLMPHTHKFFNLSAIPVPFVQGATCPIFIKYLEEVQPNPETRRLLQQWLGYNLAYLNSFQKFVIFYGDGANGKSVFCAVMLALLGLDNISALPIEAFDERRTFPLAATEGKLANICEEMNEIEKVQEGILKKFTSGGAITVERKFKDPFVLTPTARLTFATNTLPRFKDRSSGIWRRVITVPWNVKIDPSKQDRRLAKPSFWEVSEELPGILNWALEGLKDLLASGAFIEPEECTILKNQYQLDSNPALVFLRENYTSAPDTCRIGRTELYRLYRVYAESIGIHPLSAPHFSQEVERAFPEVKSTPNAVKLNSGRERSWIGLQKL